MGAARRGAYGHAMTTAPALHADHVTHHYRRTPVLRDADFAVHHGEVVAVTGENGVGKTTLLRLCAGLLAPDAGAVHRRGRVGYCPQEAGVVELLTADQHMVLFGAAEGLSRSAARAAGRRWLDAVGFHASHDLVARQLSGGTRQKLNLALALLGDPDLLLLDEPYQGFDMGAYVDFWAHVDAWRAEGRAVVIVTHLLAETRRVDRVVEIRDGAVHELDRHETEQAAP